MSVEKLRELEEKPHYMESTDERLDLRHGLGLLLVRQIVEAHGGTLRMANGTCGGFEAVLIFVSHEWKAERSVDKNAGGHKK